MTERIDGELEVARVRLNGFDRHFANVERELDLRSRPGIAGHQQDDRRDNKVDGGNDRRRPNGACDTCRA